MDEFLAELGNGDGPELSLADGFLTAIAICPGEIEQADWLEAIVGDFSHAFPGFSHLAVVTTLFERRKMEIQLTCRKEKPNFLPMIDELEDGSPLADAWCDGFMRAVEMWMEDWQPILDHPSGANLVGTIAALADDKVLAQLEPRKRKQWQHKMLLTSMLPDVIPGIDRLSRLLREDGNLDRAPSLDELLPDEKDEATNASATTPKAGRNDPCPCGSGKKFKRCCGANA